MCFYAVVIIVVNNCFLLFSLNKYYCKALITFNGCMKKKAYFRNLLNDTPKDPQLLRSHQGPALGALGASRIVCTRALGQTLPY